MAESLVLIDGSSYFFRAFHALPPLTNSKGQPTGAVFGVANMIKRLIKDYKPSKIAVVFDDKGKTFREDWYPEYKAHRPPMPSELSSQFEPLIAILKAMGLPILTIEGVEADDVIGTLALHATQQALPVVISTGDKDMAQLVNEHVTLVNTMTNQVLDIAGVEQKFGVKCNQIIDYFALMGDKVDNIPGINMCGPKTAAKWLNEYQTLENIIAQAHLISGKIGENLRAGLEQLPLSKKLVTIKTDVTLPINILDLTPTPPDKEKLIELTKALEFKQWLKELLTEMEQDTAVEKSPQEKIEFLTITNEKALQEWLNSVKNINEMAISLQTASIESQNTEVAGIALLLSTVDNTSAAYIPIGHQENLPQLSLTVLLNTLKPLLENQNIAKIGHNLKHDFCVLKYHGINLQGLYFDTMLESYVLNSTAARHDIDSLALKYLGYNPTSFTDLTGTGQKQITFDQVTIPIAGAYAIEKANMTRKLHQVLYPLLDEKLKTVFHQIEMPLMPVLADMEQAGVLIDIQTLMAQGERLKIRLKALEEECLEFTTKPFNLNSPKQLQDILFTHLKLPILSKTPTGQPSTSEEVLQELAFEYRLPAIILEYRSLSKLVSTYIDALPKRINTKTGRVHTSYNQAVAATGRLSSSEPNLQNIPTRTEEGRMIRRAFIAPPGTILLAADYSQIELRIMAHLSQDANLLQAFLKNWDIHTATAAEIFGVPQEQVNHEQRRRAKAVNFGLIYGMSAFGLGKQIGVSREEAQCYIDRYFQRYPGVLKYMEQTRKQAHELGYVETIFGRRLYLPEINTRNMTRQKAAERMAINAPMQGSAADIIKKAMLAISEWQTNNSTARMVMQVHDELVFEVEKGAIDTVKEILQSIMEKTVSLSVPLEVSVGVGNNWDEAH